MPTRPPGPNLCEQFDLAGEYLNLRTCALAALLAATVLALAVPAAPAEEDPDTYVDDAQDVPSCPDGVEVCAFDLGDWVPIRTINDNGNFSNTKCDVKYKKLVWVQRPNNSIYWDLKLNGSLKCNGGQANNNTFLFTEKRAIFGPDQWLDDFEYNAGGGQFQLDFNLTARTCDDSGFNTFYWDVSSWQDGDAFPMDHWNGPRVTADLRPC